MSPRDEAIARELQDTLGGGLSALIGDDLVMLLSERPNLRDSN